MLYREERAGQIELPAVRRCIRGQRRSARARPEAVRIDTTPLAMPLGALGPRAEPSKFKLDSTTTRVEQAGGQLRGRCSECRAAQGPSFERKQPTNSGANCEMFIPSETINLQLKIGRA